MKSKANQSGFALLMLLVILLGLGAVGLSKVLSSGVSQKNLQSKMEDQKVLQEAKDALLSYAVNYATLGELDRMGRLPCPDINAAGTEGNQDPACGGNNINAVGYFPFKSLGKGKIEDSSNECLWYVVSGEYKYRFNPPVPPNSEFGMLNWDSVGYLNLIDENGNRKHGASEDDFPIAFIISPGAAINQSRALVAALPACKANYILTNYLEGGPVLNYALGTTFPDTADTLWEIFTTSEAANLTTQDYNDHVIAIYKSELWGRIKQLGDLSYDTSPGVPLADYSSIELLTKSLAECIAAYGNDVANTNRLVPFAAPLDLNNVDQQDQYRANEHYDDEDGLRAGRFPQFLDDAPAPMPNEPNFVLNVTPSLLPPPAPETLNSYCEGVVGIEPYDELFWKNWKDHFFYIVSKDFDKDSSAPLDATRCNIDCISIFGKTAKIAAMVIFAGEKQAGQSRIWWWDEAAGNVAIDDKGDGTVDDFDHYLEGDLAAVDNSGKQEFNLSTTTTDYAWCVEYNNTTFLLSAIKCADL